MLSVPPTLAELKRRLKDASQDTLKSVGRVALALTLADGVVKQSEVRALQRLYRAIGLDDAGILDELDALSPDGKPFSQRLAEVATADDAIPVQRQAERSFALDMDRIAALAEETETVAAELSQVFDDGEPVMPSKVVPSGLDQKHGEFAFALLAQPHWEEHEVRALADSFGLALAVALPDINDWCFEHYGDALIEEHDGYELNQDVAVRIAKNQDA